MKRTHTTVGLVKKNWKFHTTASN